MKLAATAANSCKSEELLKSSTSWNGTPYDRYPPGRPQLSVIRFTIPPHTSLSWHTHPMPNAAFVISGEFTLEEKGTGKSRLVKAGEAFAESVDDIHRGYTGDTPAEIICTYAGVEGLPLSIPAP
ncbi:cupin domain-containing protein [Sinirhodobacter populi]|uniref:Cupin domain-containing protein n=2 Tax=Paenirhodobacter populi TaxID=2306993 RepID=A0A443JRJ6_9RHOB|nr:cupin domain-containing protein [Sinirhodobacter populi]